MKFSIIIPAYNCSKTIENTIQSIFLCGIKDFEILIIEDGSKDNTDVICDLLAANHPSIRCIHRKNRGVSSARNMGIEQAKGDYIWFIDSDDLIVENAFSLLEEALKDNPDMVMFGIYFDHYVRGRLSYTVPMHMESRYCFSNREWIDEFQNLFFNNMLSPVWNKVIRKDLIVKNHIRFNEHMIDMEDYLFSMQCLGAGKTVICLPDCIYRYRITEIEKSTYRRMLNISNLTDYVSQLEESVNKVLFPKIDHTVAKSIYISYFLELLRFGDIETIKNTCVDMQKGKYAEDVVENQPYLYTLAENKKYKTIHRYFLIRRLRHLLAVQYKYLISFGRKQHE